MVWLYKSGLGVIKAAIIKIMITAYLRVVVKNLGVIKPILDNKKTITGSSKAMPQPKIKLVRLSI